ncbi:hypothetical protein AZF37_00635 [endosymbiont 'TC1' of Trimyema compressum]|uniref:hypothetical protein n=1 Tax=endosymbiont 'TC1' of Trimyema compressum TaxID=243899 RepID=UPI0007F0BD26|nr:hypothetical protein [endosymbiont 'TC1' of Trimyema compressum]AMP19879.1 hypothetical protein AZF37_00635 [endosymbiont 'TC1' of Trimyema compressum]
MRNGDFDECNFQGVNPTFVVNGKYAWTVDVINTSNIIPLRKTTASDNRMEIWESNYIGVPAHSGKYLCEINAYMFASVYQVVPMTENSLYKWSFWHRGRAGADTARVWINSEENSMCDVAGNMDFTDNNNE